MKTLKITMILLATFMLVGNLHAQKWGSDDDRRSVTKDNRKVGSFDKISVSGGIDLYLKQGSNQNVTVKASERIINKVMTKVENGTLKIYMEKGHYKNVQTDVYVTVSNLVGLTASGGSDVENQTEFKADHFELHASGGSDIAIHLDVDELKCKISGGADIEIAGSGESLDLKASGGSDFDGFDFKVAHGVIVTSGSSDANVYTTESIKVNASGASDVHYKGSPGKTDIRNSGASDVHGH